MSAGWPAHTSAARCAVHMQEDQPFFALLPQSQCQTPVTQTPKNLPLLPFPCSCPVTPHCHAKAQHARCATLRYGCRPWLHCMSCAYDTFLPLYILYCAGRLANGQKPKPPPPPSPPSTPLPLSPSGRLEMLLRPGCSMHHPPALEV